MCMARPKGRENCDAKFTQALALNKQFFTLMALFPKRYSQKAKQWPIVSLLYVLGYTNFLVVIKVFEFAVSISLPLSVRKYNNKRSQVKAYKNKIETDRFFFSGTSITE